MALFAFNENTSIGEVRGVDTTKVYIRVLSTEKLINARVGRFVAMQGADANEWLIGMINRVWRDPIDNAEGLPEEEIPVEKNAVEVSLVGTYREKHEDQVNYFTRAILNLPDINRQVFTLEDKALEAFMRMISLVGAKGSETPLDIGTYSLDRRAKAILDGSKLFQRHAGLFGSTGSGKSYTVATILEQASKLPYVNVILFDLHGEYTDLPYVTQLRVAGPADLDKPTENILFLPYWLLTFDEMQSIFINYSEQAAANQATAVFESVLTAKDDYLKSVGKITALPNFTVDSPVPFLLEKFVSLLDEKNTLEIETGEFYVSGEKKGQAKTKQGPLYDKLTRLLIRLNSKIDDLRYGFMFKAPDTWNQYDSLLRLATTLLGHKGIKDYQKPGIKVIDFSEVPSDVLPVMVSLVARLVFQMQFWSESGKENEKRHPVLLVCDEAHLYLPASITSTNPIEKKAVENFERIAKEGRKYGVGLLVVSQRPADVSTTILTQCNNIISLRLTNERDKGVVKSLLSDSLQGLLEILAGLEVGEAIVVGDATVLPTRVCLTRPQFPPKSSTIDFWLKWEKEFGKAALEKAVDNFRKQSRL